MIQTVDDLIIKMRNIFEDNTIEVSPMGDYGLMFYRESKPKALYKNLREKMGEEYWESEDGVMFVYKNDAEDFMLTLNAAVGSSLVLASIISKHTKHMEKWLHIEDEF